MPAFSQLQHRRSALESASVSASEPFRIESTRRQQVNQLQRLHRHDVASPVSAFESASTRKSISVRCLNRHQRHESSAFKCFLSQLQHHSKSVIKILHRLNISQFSLQRLNDVSKSIASAFVSARYQRSAVNQYVESSQHISQSIRCSVSDEVAHENEPRLGLFIVRRWS